MRISDWSSDVCSSDLFGVERYGGFILEIGLHEDDVAAALRADLPELLDERRRDALAPVRLGHRPIVDVDLASLLLELLALISGQPADDGAILQGGKREEPAAAQQACEIGRAGPRDRKGVVGGKREAEGV